MSLSYPNAMDLKESPALQDVAIYGAATATLAGRERPDRVRVLLATGNLLDVLGIRPLLGRGFLEDEVSPAATDEVVVLAYGTWQARYGGRSDIVGQTLRLDGVEHTGFSPWIHSPSWPRRGCSWWWRAWRSGSPRGGPRRWTR